MSEAQPLPAQSQPSHSETLTSRVPGHSVIEELLAAHRLDPPRSALGRFFGARPLGSESAPWYWGALGEREIGALLLQLGPEWTVLHAVPVGKGSSDIDHVLIGPGGVFTVNTKRHAGQAVWTAKNTLMVAGQRQRHIPNAVYEAKRASKLLSAAVGHPIHVSGVVVIVGAKSLTVREKHSEIAVFTPRQLLRSLNHRRPVLTPQQIAILSAAAAQPETWHKNPQPQSDARWLESAFYEVSRKVDQARRRRVGWVLALVGTVLGTISGVLPSLLFALVR
ncbi:nuclease-related domain-containing protein [uncultured Arthrobacter sp.]|uniref:nuclease-related domain-containing protein n=1 Tax=uncultured Arthrobacter sp. TaxID=114050 RepID=UPI0026041843|nr:nuclease-related domain-containing protein [uncultured Arthrobacter sp.]